MICPLRAYGARRGMDFQFRATPADVERATQLSETRAGTDDMRRRYARLMAAASRSDDPRIGQAFEAVPREVFLPPGPWQIYLDGAYVETPSADPAYVYQNALVGLDVSKGINNGEPSLHAAWIGAVAPKSGEAVCQIGAGSGYYTALLSTLVRPNGCVHAFEIHGDLAARARQNLESFEGVTVVHGDATTLPVPPSDLVYVNAGVVSPPPHWLRALRADGRMILPWRPADRTGLAVVISRRGDAFQVEPLMAAWFIPCVGASSTDACVKAPDFTEAWTARSAWLTADRPPDRTAVAIYRDVWFSSASLA